MKKKTIKAWGIVDGEGYPIVEIVSNFEYRGSVWMDKKQAQKAAKCTSWSADEIRKVVPVTISYQLHCK